MSEVVQQFSELLTTADTISEARGLFLDLAVSGRLTSGSASAAEAQAVVQQVVSARQALIAAGNLRDRKNQRRPIEPEVALPANWASETVERLTTKVGSGSTPRGGKAVYTTSGVKFLRSQNIYNDGLRLDGVALIPAAIHEKMSGTHVEAGDVLLNITGASIGRCAHVPDDFDTANVSQHVAIIRPVLPWMAPWVHLCMISPTFQRTIMATQVGISREGLSMTSLRCFQLPIPPRAEQEMIVLRAQQLLALCDELEAKQTQKRQTRTRLDEACLDRLLTAQAPDEFAEHWQRIHDNFDLLYDAPADMGPLREGLRELALTGRLVAPKDTGETSEKLLAEISTERENRHVSKRLRNTRQVEPLTDKDRLYEAPTHWRWERFGLVADISGGVTKGRKLGNRETAMFPYLRVANVQRGYLDLRLVKEIVLPVDELDKYTLEVGDVLLTEGGDWDKLGRSAIWNGEVTPCLHQNHVFRARSLHDGLRPRWISLLSNSPVGRRYFADSSKQTTNLASINMTQLRALPIPIPPTNEQDEILGRLDALLEMCSQLEEQLLFRESSAKVLLAALVNSLVIERLDPPESEQGRPKTKPPHSQPLLGIEA